MSSPRGRIRRWGCLLGAVCLLLAPVGTAAAGGYALEDWIRRDSSWNDFGVGTMTHVRKTRIMDVPGLPAGRRVVFEERRTLMSKDATIATIRVERRVDEKGWVLTDITEKLSDASPGKAQKVLDAQGQPVLETLRIEGVAYPCVKYDAERQVGDERERAYLWVHEVQGVLKYEGRGGLGRASGVSWTVTRLGEKRTIDAHTLVARQLAIKGSEIAGTMLVSADVPGSIIEETLNVTKNAVKTRNMRELIAFVKK